MLFLLKPIISLYRKYWRLSCVVLRKGYKQGMGSILEQNNQENQVGKPVKKAEAKKPAKNLYEPYSTPRIAYEVMRYFVRLVCFLTMRMRLRGRYNLPRKGPYIIAANHLSWLDI